MMDEPARDGSFGAKPEATDLELELPLSAPQADLPARASSLSLVPLFGASKFPVTPLKIPCSGSLGNFVLSLCNQEIFRRSGERYARKIAKFPVSRGKNARQETGSLQTASSAT